MKMAEFWHIKANSPCTDRLRPRWTITKLPASLKTSANTDLTKPIDMSWPVQCEMSLSACICIWIYTRDAQTQSWRAGVLQSLAPTCLNTPAWKFLVCLIRAWLAASGVFNRHCRTPALQDRVWAPLIYSNFTWKILPIFSVVLPSSLNVMRLFPLN